MFYDIGENFNSMQFEKNFAKDLSGAAVRNINVQQFSM